MTLPCIEAWWVSRRDRFYSAIVIPMALLALMKLGGEFVRLLFEFHDSSAIDLKLFQVLTRDWVQGLPVYELHSFATYPPASHLMLWPIFGPFSLTITRILWAAIQIALLVWLTRFTLRAGFAEEASPERKRFLALVLLSMNATGVAIGNGQITLAALWLLALFIERMRGESGLSAGAVFLFALAKPNISVPFFWILLLVPGSLVPGMLAGVLYAGVTLMALQFQNRINAADIFADWLARGVELEGGYGNIHSLLSSAGLEQLLLPLQMAVLILLGIWVYKNRRGDLWLLVGTTAIVSRLWTYHRVYDDVIVLFAILALIRYAIGVQKPLKHAFLLEWLALINVLALLLPARMHDWPQPFEFLFKGGHVLIWIVDLIVLLYLARITGSSEEPSPGKAKDS